MIDEKLARLRTHRNNISRYRRLLKTQLTDCERQFIEKRLSEERSAMEQLAASTFSSHLPNAGAGGYETPTAVTSVRSQDRDAQSISNFRNRREEGPANDVAVVHMHKRRGCLVMRGSETTRPAARYKAERAAFPAAAVRPVSRRY